MKALSELPHQLQMAGVARMNRARIRAYPHVQSDDGANPRQLRNGRGRVDSSLDSSHVRARQADGSGDFGGRQTAGYPSVSEVGANGAQVVSSETRSSVDRSFSGRHAMSVTALAHLALIAAWCIPRPYRPTNGPAYGPQEPSLSISSMPRTT